MGSKFFFSPCGFFDVPSERDDVGSHQGLTFPRVREEDILYASDDEKKRRVWEWVRLQLLPGEEGGGGPSCEGSGGRGSPAVAPGHRREGEVRKTATARAATSSGGGLLLPLAFAAGVLLGTNARGRRFLALTLRRRQRFILCGAGACPGISKRRTSGRRRGFHLAGGGEVCTPSPRNRSS